MNADAGNPREAGVAVANTPPELPPQLRPALLLATILTATVTTILVVCLLPDSFRGVALVWVGREARAAAGHSARSGPPDDRAVAYLQREAGFILSAEVLQEAAELVDLNRVYSKRYNRGEPMKPADVVELVRGRLRLVPKVDANLIRIESFGELASEAATVANGVAEAYVHLARRRLERSVAPTAALPEIAWPAQLETAPVRPNHVLTSRRGSGIGAGAGAVLMAVVYLVQKRNWRRTGGTVASTLPRHLRRGVQMAVAILMGAWLGYLVAMPMNLLAMIELPCIFVVGCVLAGGIELIRPGADFLSPHEKQTPVWR